MLNDYRDGEPPLMVHGTEIVFQEQGGASFAVQAVHTTIRATGEPLTLHVASVKDGRPGAVCAVVLPGHGDGHTPKGTQDLSDRRYLLARHWRVATNEWEWEFPRGMGKSGETVQQTAARELKEETALQISEDSISILQIIHADTGVLRDAIAVAEIRLDDSQDYLPLEGSKKPNGADWELDNFRWVDVKAFREAINRGEIVDGITLSAFLICESAQEPMS